MQEKNMKSETKKNSFIELGILSVYFVLAPAYTNLCRGLEYLLKVRYRRFALFGPHCLIRTKNRLVYKDL